MSSSLKYFPLPIYFLSSRFYFLSISFCLNVFPSQCFPLLIFFLSNVLLTHLNIFQFPHLPVSSSPPNPQYLPLPISFSYSPFSMSFPLKVTIFQCISLSIFFFLVVFPSQYFSFQYPPFSMSSPLKIFFSHYFPFSMSSSRKPQYFPFPVNPPPPNILSSWYHSLSVSFPLNIIPSQYHSRSISFPLNIFSSQLFPLSMFSFLKPKYPALQISPVSISSLANIFSYQYLPLSMSSPLNPNILPS